MGGGNGEGIWNLPPPPHTFLQDQFFQNRGETDGVGVTSYNALISEHKNNIYQYVAFRLSIKRV